MDYVISLFEAGPFLTIHNASKLSAVETSGGKMKPGAIILFLSTTGTPPFDVLAQLNSRDIATVIDQLHSLYKTSREARDCQTVIFLLAIVVNVRIGRVASLGF
jgi:hypothetical protein